MPSQVLDGLDRTGSIFREVLHVLQELCISQAVLPATYEVTDEISFKKPFTYGGLDHPYKGSLGGADVGVKRVPKFRDDDRWVDVMQVPHPRYLYLDRHALTSFGDIPQGGSNMEVPQSPEYCALQGCHLQSLPTRVRMDAWWAVD